MPTATQTIRQQIHDHVVSTFLFDSGDIADDASLLDEGVVDSMGVLGLVLFVEEQFGIAVAEREVVPDNFDSIDALAAFVQGRLDWARERLAS